MKLAIVFATLSGNTLEFSRRLQAHLLAQAQEAPLLDLLNLKLSDFLAYDLVFLGSSTYDGGLNPIAEVFFERVTETFDLSSTKFALFSLGDSTYPDFAKSGEHIATRLAPHRAQILSPIQVIDGGVSPENEALLLRWADTIRLS